jgi:uncharacterized UBP type Zn finger protein
VVDAEEGASAEDGVASTSSSPGRGLVNLGGNSCFLSSVLQVLARLPSVRSLNLCKEGGCAHAFCSSCQLGVLMGELGRNERGAARADTFYQQLLPAKYDRPTRASGKAPPPCAIGPDVYQGRQCDAHTLLIGLLDHAGEVATRCQVSGSALWDLFQGKLCSTQEWCEACEHTSEKTETFLTLQLPFEESIDAALSRYFEAERMSGENQIDCEKCNAKCDGAKRLSIETLPRVVALQLMRFDYKESQAVKISDHARFESEQEIGGRSCTLRAIVVHRGGDSTESGHYTAWVRIDDSWHHFDDENVSGPFPFARVQEESAYLLFYEANSPQVSISRRAQRHLRVPHCCTCDPLRCTHRRTALLPPWPWSPRRVTSPARARRRMSPWIPPRVFRR